MHRTIAILGTLALVALLLIYLLGNLAVATGKSQKVEPWPDAPTSNREAERDAREADAARNGGARPSESTPIGPDRS